MPVWFTSRKDAAGEGANQLIPFAGREGATNPAGTPCLRNDFRSCGETLHRVAWAVTATRPWVILPGLMPPDHRVRALRH